MNVGDMLDFLKNRAKEFRLDHDNYTRNAHMHEVIGFSPTQDEVDAVLVGFINYVGTHQGCDYALYASDFSKETAEAK